METAGPAYQSLKGTVIPGQGLGGWALVLGGVLIQLGFEPRESAARSHRPPLFP